MSTESIRDHYVKRFEVSKADRSARATNAFSAFAEKGVPTRKWDAWNNSKVHEWLSPRCVSGEDLDFDLTLAKAAIWDLAPDTLVFVNGRFCAELSTRGVGSLGGVRVSRIADVVANASSAIETALNQDLSSKPLQALNVAFSRDGLCVIFEEGRKSTPVHLVHVTVGAGAFVDAHPHNLVVVEPGNNGTLIESFVGSDSQDVLVNNVTDVILAAGATFDHLRLFNDERAATISACNATVERDATYLSGMLALGCGKVRNDLSVKLNGVGASCRLSGIFLTDGHDHSDHATVVEHASGKTEATQVYKGIAGGDSAGVFNGKIIVHKDAQKVEARQLNRNLVMSPSATINTRPQLEIYADDVVCSHGATTGQLDKDAVFYLRSRGLAEQTAKRMLAEAFCSDVVEGLSRDETLRERLQAEVFKAIPAASP